MMSNITVNSNLVLANRPKDVVREFLFQFNAFSDVWQPQVAAQLKVSHYKTRNVALDGQQRQKTSHSNQDLVKRTFFQFGESL